MATVSERTYHDGQPLFAPWLDHYPACVPARLDYPQKPIWHLLESSAAAFPNRIACTYYEQRLTYAELWESARRAAALFSKLGVRPGDRVGVLLPNVPEFLTVAYGAWLAGAVIVPLSPLAVAEELSDLMDSTDCRVVVALDLLAPLITRGKHHVDHLLLVSIREHLPLWKRVGYSLACLKRNGLSHPKSSHVHSLVEGLAQADLNFAPPEIALDSPAYILATGGTTGLPKAVVLSHRNLMANAWQIFHWSGCRVGKDSYLSVLPFFHSYGLSTCATAGIASAATLVLYQKFDTEVVLKLIEQHRPTVFHAVPAMLAALNTALREKPRDLSSLQFSISGGAALDPAIAAEFATHSGATVVEGFGLSEASPVTHVGPLDGTAKPGTIGLPLPDTEARIVDAETGRITLPPGEVGELVVRGPQVMLGYWNNPEQTARTIRDGWLFTGDLGTYDEDGFFKIVDRKKDLIITSGFNVYPTDVEQMLRRFPGVKDVAVIGVPDAQRGEIVKAVLTLEPGVTFDRKAFDRFTHEHLGKQKQPRIVEVLGDDLPRNFLGKVLRRKLRDGHAPDAVSANGTVLTDDSSSTDESSSTNGSRSANEQDPTHGNGVVSADGEASKTHASDTQHA